MRDRKNTTSTASLAPPLRAMLRTSGGILDMLPVATFVCDAQGVILQYNRRAVEIWGRAPAPGQTDAQFAANSRFYAPDGSPAGTLLSDVLRTGAPVRDAERVIDHADGTRVAVSINIDPLFDAKGAVIGAVNCFLDITERKRVDDALEKSRAHALEQEQRLAATYEHAAIGISEVDPDGSFRRVNEAIATITGFSREHLLASRIFAHTHPDDIDADRQAFRKQVAGELELYSIEKRFVRPDGRLIWVSVHSSPVRAGDRLLYVVRVVQDITERKAAEQRQKLLIDELNHRVKNALATVQSLAAHTARTARTPADFRESFEGRLIALSKAHDQLTVHHWESADLRQLLTGGFAPYGLGPEQVVLRGEDLVLRPRAVLTLAMAFHELITNAAKYGALSASGGRVEIRWQLGEADSDGRRQLCIEWTEKGGPRVADPGRRGFGSRLIEGGVVAELGGSARLTFAREGLRCVFKLPMETVTLHSGRGAETGGAEGI